MSSACAIVSTSSRDKMSSKRIALLVGPNLPLERRAYCLRTSPSIVSARVAGVPSPFPRIASAKSSSSTNLPAVSIMRRSWASEKRGGGLVSLDSLSPSATSTSTPSAFCWPSTSGGSRFSGSSESSSLRSASMKPGISRVRSRVRNFSATPSTGTSTIRSTTAHVAGPMRDARNWRTTRS